MYKLLVVDDEFHIRDGIVHVIPWDQYGITVVGEASDGIEALGKMEMLQPDIVITDIEMDPMNGLELATMIKRDYPQVKTIILTGYDEFEYARRAVSLGVCSYVLKPVLPQELIELMTALTAELDEKAVSEAQRLKEEQRIRDRLITELLDSSGSIVRRDIRRSINDDAYICVLFAEESATEAGVVNNVAEVSKWQNEIGEMATDVFSTLYETSVCGYEGDECLLVLDSHNYVKADELSVMEDIEIRVERLRQQIQVKFGIELIYGISSLNTSALDLDRSMHEAKLCIKRERLRRSSEDGTTCKTVIVKAKEYIESHYGDADISLETIASYLYLTPSYFSKLYKEETGESYITYLTDVRLNDAKSQLRDTNRKIIEIGESVGYRNAQYFGTLFKRNTGLTPAQYRASGGDEL